MIRNHEDVSEPDEWMDVRDLCAYHPNHPSKEGKHIRFCRSEIDTWLAKGYHRTDDELVEDTIGYINYNR